MVTVTGRVSVAETDVPVPGLVVSFHDYVIDPELADPRSGGPPRVVAGDGPPPGDRLGSVLSDEGGAFTLSLDGTVLAPLPGEPDPKTPGRSGERVASTPNLVVAVSAPDSADSADGTRPLYVSPFVRFGAGSSEAFSIRIPAATLLAAGIAPTSAPPDAAPIVTTMTRAESASGGIRAGARTILADRAAQVRAARAAYEEGFESRLRSELSRIPSELVRPGRLIGAGESVQVKNRTAIQEGVQDKMQHAAADRLQFRHRLFLDAAQQARLRELLGDQAEGELSHEQVTQLLSGDQPDPAHATPTALVSEDELLDRFLAESEAERCAAETLGLPGTDTPESGDDSSDTGPATPADLVDRLTDPMTAPEQLGTALPLTRADRDDVQASVAGFSLRPGPAESPAFFDFHRLEMAFDDVWQEVLDDDLLLAARTTHAQVVRLGGDPDHQTHSNSSAVRALFTEAETVEEALRAAPPPAVPPQAITRRSDQGGTHSWWDRWLDLSGDILGDNIRDHRDDNVRDRRGASVRRPAGA